MVLTFGPVPNNNSRGGTGESYVLIALHRGAYSLSTVNGTLSFVGDLFNKNNVHDMGNVGGDTVSGFISAAGGFVKDTDVFE